MRAWIQFFASTKSAKALISPGRERCSPSLFCEVYGFFSFLFSDLPNPKILTHQGAIRFTQR